MSDKDRLESMLHRVRALLAKAEATDFPEEREMLNHKASELIARYGIDAALLAADDPTTDKITDRWITIQAPYARDKLMLLNAVAEPLRVKLIAANGPHGTWRGHLFGYGADIERAEILYTSLLVQAASGLQRARPQWPGSIKAFRRTWLVGFAAAVEQRLTASENAAETAATETATVDGPRSVALVLADRSALVTRAASAAHPDTRKSGTRRLQGTGLASGHSAGMRANLGTDQSDLTKHANRRQLG